MSVIAWNQIDQEVSQIRQADPAYGPRWFDIDDLPLSRAQKECVLEWYAMKIWKLEGPDHHKSYDPLTIEGNVAHSYVFNLDNGGRHHEFGSLKDLELMLDQELNQVVFHKVNEGEM